MTGPEDSQNTRPISVAELLARNGTIGAPPAGGRRRRRRGDTDSISVAELTGEIPIITDHVVEQPRPEQPTEEPVVEEAPVEEAVDQSETHVLEPVVDEPVEEVDSPASTNGVVEHTDVEPETAEDEADAEAEAEEPADVGDVPAEAEEAEEVDDDYADAVSDYAAHIEQRDTDVDLPFFAPPRRSSSAQRRLSVVGDAEEMSPDPDPVDEDTALDWSEAEAGSAEGDDVVAEGAVSDVEEDAKQPDSEPSYLRTTAGPLFGGQSVADDLARRRPARGPEEIDLDEQAEAAPPQKAISSFMHGVWIVGQCVLAVAFGAGLFVAFDQLWKWNNIVALVLSVLVILGLVVGVRVVRKTEDIGSTLIAVAVGALVTLGPLALLQSG